MSTFNKIINCLALDPINSRVREDAFFYEKRKNSWKFMVIVVIPPVKLIKLENIDENIQKLLNRSSDLPYLFSKKNKIECCLKEHQLRRVLAVEYFINKKGEIKQEIVLPKLARAVWINHNNHNSEEICNDVFNLIKLVHQNHPNGETLQKKAKRWSEYDLSFDNQLSNLLCDLFNFTCRSTCLANNIPYYHPLGGNIYSSNKEQGRFNRPMRDIIALINLLNLYNHILGRNNCIIEEKDLFIFLGGKYKIFTKQTVE